MKIVSWNMGCAPIRARYRKTHAEAWRYLLDTLKPDVAFVQEALIVNPVVPEDGTVVWSDPRGTDSGTAIFVRRGIAFHRETVASEGSYVAAVSLLYEGFPTLFVSIHTGPPNYRKSLKTLRDALSEKVSGQRFVIGGDWNAARHWDTVHGTKWYGKYFESLAQQQMVDCHWTQHGKEVPTLFRKQDKNAYQCDHFFTDVVTATAAKCAVLPHMPEFSDHSAVELVLSRSAAGVG